MTHFNRESNFIGSPGHSTKTVTVGQPMSIERSNFIGPQGDSTKAVIVNGLTWDWLVTHVNREVKFDRISRAFY